MRHDQAGEAGGNILRIDLTHKQVFMMATLIEELRREQHHMARFANGAVGAV